MTTNNDPEIDAALAELADRYEKRERDSAKRKHDAIAELECRHDVGHTGSCVCQSRPGLNCRELRKLAGWREVRRIFG